MSVERKNGDKNDDHIYCKWCNCKVLRPGYAEYIVKDIELPKANTSADQIEIDTVQEHWQVNDRYDFENVGVTKAKSVNESMRYLTCADCDRGPIGISWDLKTFYIADSRIKHDSK